MKWLLISIGISILVVVLVNLVRLIAFFVKIGWTNLKPKGKDMTTGDLFIKFLKEQGVLEEFEVNLRDHGEYTSIEHLIETFGENSPESFILEAFVWKSTIQQSSFWQDLNNKWLELINKINKL